MVAMKISFAPLRILVLAVALFLLIRTDAADSGNYDGPKWSFLDAKAVLASARDITPAKYPDCDEATVDKKMVRVYRADGTGEAQDESFRRCSRRRGSEIIAT